MMKPWLSCSSQRVRLTLHVQPGARKTELAGEHGDALKIRLAAPPVDGKANIALLAWVARRFDLPARAVTLVSGEKSRHKIVQLDCELTLEQVLATLEMSVD